MPALNFQKQFAEKVRSGKKLQTIRAFRKRPFEVGDKLYLYTGLRTKICKKLGEALCSDVANIDIIDCETIKIDGSELSKSLRDEMAVNDGFKDFQQMVEWFNETHGLPFVGQLIKWDEIFKNGMFDSLSKI